jgi:hypothetical protein
MRSMRLHGVLATLAVLAIAMATTAPAAAQGPLTPVPGAFCTLLTSDEVSAAFGVPMELTGISGKSCSWTPVGMSTTDASLVPSLLPGTLADNKKYFKDFPGGIKDITVGGQPGLLRVHKDATGNHGSIFAEALDQVLEMDWDDYAGVSKADLKAALTQVMGAALPRMSSITFAEPTQQPGPSLVPDPDLAALFPATIGGQPVTVNTMQASYILSFFASSPEAQGAIQHLSDQLAAQGKTVDDLSYGNTQVTLDDKSVSIQALRVKGGDAAAIMDATLALTTSQMTSPQTSTAQVAGRDVTVTQDGDAGTKTYALPSGEVIWFVQADEPALSEVIGALH